MCADGGQAVSLALHSSGRKLLLVTRGPRSQAMTLDTKVRACLPGHQCLCVPLAPTRKHT